MTRVSNPGRPLTGEGADEKVLFKLASDLGNMLGVIATSEQLQPLMQRLLQGLNDPDHFASAGACLVVNGMSLICLPPNSVMCVISQCVQVCSAAVVLSWTSQWSLLFPS